MVDSTFLCGFGGLCILMSYYIAYVCFDNCVIKYFIYVEVLGYKPSKLYFYVNTIKAILTYLPCHFQVPTIPL